MVKNSTNINQTNNGISPQITEHTRHGHICLFTLFSVMIWFDLLCLPPLSAIFQLYHGDQF